MLGDYHKKARRLEWFWGNQVQAYRIPKWANFVYIYSQAAGAGGGGANGVGPIANAWGGSGGCPGTTVIALIPAVVLPDSIFIQSSVGGNGGVGESQLPTAGGNNSIFCRYGLTGSVDIIQNNGGGIGGANYQAGSAPTTPTVNRFILSMSIVTVPTPVGGQNSAIGAGISVSANLTNHCHVTPGASGAGQNAGTIYNGGDVTVTEFVMSEVVAGGVNTGNKEGKPGLWLPELLLSTGGSGGASMNPSAKGGDGGNGGPGSGGGGGGSGEGTGNNSNGGKGGDGFIIVGVL